MDNSTLLYLLQLVSPTLPVGAYSYSEGIETLIDRGIINSKESLEGWLKNELCYGTIRTEVAVMLRIYQSIYPENLAAITYWNAWLSATRETQELRQQSRQMGRSLLKLLIELQPSLEKFSKVLDIDCNYAVAFGIAAAGWQIEPEIAAIAYLHSWLSNLISAGVRLIPLGQTAGQQILFNLNNLLTQIMQEILVLKDEELSSCSWGLTLASMAHQTQYTRLFRS